MPAAPFRYAVIPVAEAEDQRQSILRTTNARMATIASQSRRPHRGKRSTHSLLQPWLSRSTATRRPTHKTS